MNHYQDCTLDLELTALNHFSLRINKLLIIRYIVVGGNKTLFHWGRNFLLEESERTNWENFKGVILNLLHIPDDIENLYSKDTVTSTLQVMNFVQTFYFFESEVFVSRSAPY